MDPEEVILKLSRRDPSTVLGMTKQFGARNLDIEKNGDGRTKN